MYGHQCAVSFGGSLMGPAIPRPSGRASASKHIFSIYLGCGSRHLYRRCLSAATHSPATRRGPSSAGASSWGIRRRRRRRPPPTARCWRRWRGTRRTGRRRHCWKREREIVIPFRAAAMERHLSCSIIIRPSREGAIHLLQTGDLAQRHSAFQSAPASERASEPTTTGTDERTLLIMWVQKVGHFNPIYTTLYHKLNIAKFWRTFLPLTTLKGAISPYLDDSSDKW